MSTTPPMHAPAGGDQNEGYRLTVVALVTVIVAFITVSLREFTRMKIMKALGWDDAFLIIALVFAICATGLELSGVTWGLGRHAFYLDPNQKEHASRFSAIGQAFCITSLSFCKLSIAAAFQRLIEGTGRRLAQGYLWFSAAAAFIVNLVTVVFLFAQCNPVGKNYNPKMPGSCWDPQIYDRTVLAQGVISAVTDFSLALFPGFILYKLQIPIVKKVMVIALMSLGFITGIFAIVRTAYTGPYSKQDDPTWTSINLLIWANIERNVAIICISLPVIPRLGAPLKASWFSLSSRLTGSSKGSQSKTYASGKEDYGQSQGQYTMHTRAPRSTKSFDRSTNQSVHDGTGVSPERFAPTASDMREMPKEVPRDYV